MEKNGERGKGGIHSVFYGRRIMEQYGSMPITRYRYDIHTHIIPCKVQILNLPTLHSTEYVWIHGRLNLNVQAFLKDKTMRQTGRLRLVNPSVLCNGIVFQPLK